MSAVNNFLSPSKSVQVDEQRTSGVESLQIQKKQLMEKVVLTRLNAATLDHQPAVLLNKICGYCSTVDIFSFCRINKSFLTGLLRQTKAGSSSLNQVLLEHVTRTSTITSVKMLKKQLKGLQNHYPDKFLSLADVLVIMLPSLRAIDFSEERVTKEEMTELMNAFDKVREKADPIGEKTFKRETITSHLRGIEETLTTDQKATLCEEFFLQSLMSLSHDLWVMWLNRDPTGFSRILEESSREPHELLRTLQRLFPEISFEIMKVDVMEKPYADVRYLNFGTRDFFQNNEAVERFFQFLKAFCPRLSHLKMNNTLCSSRWSFFEDNYADSLVQIDFGRLQRMRLGAREENGIISPNLEYHSESFVETPDFALERIESCPKLTNAQIRTSALGWEDRIVPVLNRLAECCPQIRILELDIVSIEKDENKIRSLASILGKFKHLKEVIIGVESFTNTDLKLLLSQVKRFERLAFIYPMEASLLLKVPEDFPRLKCLDLSGSDFSIHPTTLCHLALKYPNLQILRPLSIDSSQGLAYRGHYLSVDDILDNFFLLRDLNQKLKSGNCPGREIFEDLQKLRANLLWDVYYFTWVHAGMPNIPDYGKRILRDNIETLTTMTLPFVSARGTNLLEQLAWREFETLDFIEISYQWERWDDALHESVDKKRYIIESLNEDVKQKVKSALREKFKREGNNVGLSDLQSQSLEDRDVISIWETVQAQARTLMESKMQRRVKLQLQAFKALMDVEKVTPKQLLEVYYKMFEIKLKDDLAGALWVVSGKPQESGFGERRIRKDIRSLQDVVAQRIASMPSDPYYIPDPSKTKTEHLKEVLTFIDDPNVTQTRLLQVFAALDSDLRDNLMREVWIAHNSPQEWQYGERVIRENVRCLKPVIEKMVAKQ